MNVLPPDYAESHSFYRIVVVLLVGTVVGVLASLLALGFLHVVRLLNDTFWISARSRVFLAEQPELLLLVTLSVPIIGGLIVGCVINPYLNGGKSLSPVDTIYAAQARDTRRFGFKQNVLSLTAMVVSLGSGASVGQYGPMVVAGSLIGARVAHHRLLIPNLLPIAIASGVAAAISAAFNAPIAGIIFAHEVVLRHYSMQAFAPVTVASSAGFVMANVVFDTPPLFEVAFEQSIAIHEFFLFALCGTGSAFIAVFFMQCTLKGPEYLQALPPRFRPAFAGLVVGVVAYFLPEAAGIGQEALRFATIEGAFAAHELLLLIVTKLFLTALCLSSGFAGGVFSPSLLMGILYGGLFWSGVNGLMPEANAGLVVYAICGMTALASPIIGAPLTMILIIFELTRQYDLTIAAMVAVVFSHLFAYRLFGRSLFDRQLKQRGMDLSLGRDRAVLGLECIQRFARQDYFSLSPHLSLAQAREQLLSVVQHDAIILEGSTLKGRLTLRGIDKAPHDATLEEIIEPFSLVFTETTTVWEAMAEVQDFVGEYIPVIDSREEGRLIGVVTEGDVVRAYTQRVNNLRAEENASV